MKLTKEEWRIFDGIIKDCLRAGLSKELTLGIGINRIMTARFLKDLEKNKIKRRRKEVPGKIKLLLALQELEKELEESKKKLKKRGVSK